MRVAACLVIGLFFGSVGAMVQTYTIAAGSATIPLGAVLALAAAVPVARACAWWVLSRWGAVAFSAGWLGATLMMGSVTPGGDLVLSSGTRQVSYLVVGTMLLAAACGYSLLPADDKPQPVAEAGHA